MMKDLRIFAACCALWCSCTPAPVSAPPVYFSVTAWLDSLLQTPAFDGMRLRKQVTYAGREETATTAHPDWKKELQPFYDADINKPAYAGAFTADTLVRQGMREIRYTTTAAKIPVRQLTITYTENQISQVRIRYKKSNAWFRLEQELRITPREGYSISGTQNMAIGEEVSFTIAGRFVPKNQPVTP